MYIFREIEVQMQRAVARGKSILLLGPRQTGKTTLIERTFKVPLSYDFVDPETRLRYEADISLLKKEIMAASEQLGLSQKLLVFIDEVQRIPVVLDLVQYLVDKDIAQFILSASSARKINQEKVLNLLPGRIVAFHLAPLMLTELPSPLPDLQQLLAYGSLPGILTTLDTLDQQADLLTYVQTYLDEEIRQEALVRDVGSFARFLSLAAAEAGQLLNINKLSQALGLRRKFIQEYYQILEDCLIIDKIEPLLTISRSTTRRRLTRSPKYLFFDSGVRRVCANEGTALPASVQGYHFEQWVGMELIRYARVSLKRFGVYYWRDHNGPEVDYVLEGEGAQVPVEVKLTDNPTEKDIRHLKLFLAEHEAAKQGFVVCTAPRPLKLADNITAIPWQNLM